MTVADQKKAKIEELKAKALNKEIEEISEIFNHILEGNYTENDVQTVTSKILRITVNGDSNYLKIGNNYINIGEGRDIHIGDRIYKGESADTIREIIREVVNDQNKEITESKKEITERIEKLEKIIQEYQRQQEEKERLRQEQEQQEKERLRQKQEQQEKESLRQEQEHQRIFGKNTGSQRFAVHSQPNSQNNSNTQGVGVKGS
ncbi:hypothetical protein [Calothrix rhizosoleniae]|uniref:hypothetical protein n=1 Tax=Calothrix rhizosoleniae TaxID=888997 RepID=UPI000B4A1DBE|nr:hypothetical protein [Calothrix rhizosoleniae]